MKNKLFFLVLCLSLFCTNEITSQNFSALEMGEIKELCKTDGGIYDIVKIIKSKNNQDLKFTAQALKITYEEHLYDFALKMCNKGADGAPIYTFDYDGTTNNFDYGGMYCTAGWDKDCEFSQEYILPPGYQACSIEYAVHSRRGETEIIKEPISWFEGDSENPPRFRGYKLTLISKGSKTILDQKGANIHIKNIRIKGILTNLNNEERFNKGCEIPKQKVVLPPSKPSSPQRNQTTKYSTTHVLSSRKCSFYVYFMDTSDGNIECNKWILKGIVEPNAPMSLSVEEGKSGQIVVNRYGDDPCPLAGGRMWYANIVPRNLNQNKTIYVKPFHDFDCISPPKDEKEDKKE